MTGNVIDAPQRLGSAYTALWTSATISSLGDGIRFAALPLLALTITQAPASIALITVAGQLPALTLSLLSGVLADRYDRRRTMWLCDAARCAIAMILAVLAASGHLSVPALCLIALAMGTGQTLADQAAHALLPAIIDQANLIKANSRLMSARTAIGYFAGPLLGGALFATAHALPFAADAGTFLTAGLIIAVAVTPRQAPTPAIATRPGTEPVRSQINEGLRYVWRNRPLRGIAAVITAVNFTQAATQAMLPLLATQGLHLGERGYGTLLAACGAGAALTGICGPWIRRIYGTDRLFTFAVVGTVAVFTGLGLTSDPILAGVLLAVNAALGVLAGVIITSLRQAIVPDHLLGRVNSVMTLLGTGVGLTAGSLAGGALATIAGIRAPYLASAVVITLTTLALPRITPALRRAAAVR